MIKEKKDYLSLPTKEVLQFLGGQERRSVYDAINAYLMKKLRGRRSSNYLGGENPEKNWVDSCVGEVVFQSGESDAPFFSSIDAAVEALRKKDQREYNEFFHSNKVKSSLAKRGLELGSTKKEAKSFFDSGNISPEGAKDCHFVKVFDPYVQFIDRIQKEAVTSKNKEMKDATKDFKEFFASWAVDTLRGLQADGHSVYYIAKKDGVDYRKLLYVLKKIGFPLAELKAKKESYFIFPDRQALFEHVYKGIKWMWKCEENYKSWTKALLHRGWSKSRASQFMSRRIKSGDLPEGFFDFYAANEFRVSRLISNDLGWADMKPNLLSKRQLLAELKDVVMRAKKSVFNS